MLLRSIFFVTGITSVFAIWAIAVSADDAKQGRFRADPAVAAAEAGY